MKQFLAAPVHATQTQIIYNSINKVSNNFVLLFLRILIFVFILNLFRIIFKILLKYFHEYINILNIRIFNPSLIQIIYLFISGTGWKQVRRQASDEQRSNGKDSIPLKIDVQLPIIAKLWLPSVIQACNGESSPGLVLCRDGWF